jgi:hypothetical protein
MVNAWNLGDPRPEVVDRQPFKILCGHDLFRSLT